MTLKSIIPAKVMGLLSTQSWNQSVSGHQHNPSHLQENQNDHFNPKFKLLDLYCFKTHTKLCANKMLFNYMIDGNLNLQFYSIFFYWS